MTEEERMGIQNTIQSIQKRLDSLRIPKGMTVGHAVYMAWVEKIDRDGLVPLNEWLDDPDTDLQAEIDKIGDDDE